MKIKNLKEGLFITFEGGEGSGKTSLSKALYKQLMTYGYEVYRTRAPGGTALGMKIREALLHTQDVKMSQKAELLLFLADRAQHVDEIILPYLHRRWIVLCDRFTDSTLAYQGASRKSLNTSDVEFLSKFAVGGLEPHLTFYLDIDPFIGLERAKKAITLDGKASYDRLEEESMDFHKNVRQAYLNIASKNSKRIKILDASLSKQDVFDRALEIIQNSLIIT